MNHTRSHLLAIALVSSLTSAGDAVGDALQSHESIADAAVAHMQTLHAGQQQGQLQISSGQLDKRLSLHQCDKELETFMPAGAKENGNTTVGVRCDGSKPWMIYVPVAVSQWGEVLVSVRPLSKGIINAGDFKPVARNLSVLSRGYLTQVEEVIGKRLKTPLTAGAVLRPDMLEIPSAISKGQKVTLISGQGSLQVRMPGKALNSGGLGSRIQVENLASQKIVEGVVAENATVKVGI